MKAKVKSTGAIIDIDDINGVLYETSTHDIYAKSELDFPQTELTWRDIKNIDDWLSVIQTSDNLVGKELYEEVLRRFNEAKNNRQRK